MNIEDLIGKKVRVHGTSLTPGAESKFVDIILESIEELEDPIPDEPIGALRVEMVNEVGRVDSYVYSAGTATWTREGVSTFSFLSWTDLVRKARTVGATLRAVNETATDLT